MNNAPRFCLNNTLLTFMLLSSQVNVVIAGGVTTGDAPQTLAPLKTIELIFNNQMAIVDADNIKASLEAHGVSVSAYNLDGPDAAMQFLNANLPTNPEQAKAIVLSRLNGAGGGAFKQETQAAFQALGKTLGYGLDRYPAAVFNQGQAVVYGVTDLKQAVGLFQQWRAKS